MSNVVRVYVALTMTLSAFFMIVSCGENTGREMTPTHNAEETDFTINIKTFRNSRQLNRYIEKNNIPTEGEVDGVAQWSIKPIEGATPSRCNVYVVQPNSQTDHATMETWGHELMHCVYGSYHAEGVRQLNMAKYTRYDPRNKKKNRHKDQYLDRSSKKNKRVQVYGSDFSEQEISRFTKDYQ